MLALPLDPSFHNVLWRCSIWFGSPLSICDLLVSPHILFFPALWINFDILMVLSVKCKALFSPGSNFRVYRGKRKLEPAKIKFSMEQCRKSNYKQGDRDDAQEITAF